MWEIIVAYLQFGRYSFLGLGIAYGAYHQNRLSKKEAKIREIEAEQKKIRDAKLAIEKKRIVEGKINLEQWMC